MERIHEINVHLEVAQVILLLVSPDFIASDYCYDFEVRKAIEKHKAGEAYVIPILLRPVEWDGAPFSKLEPLPTNRKPVTVWPNRDNAFLNISKGIRNAIENLPKKPDARSKNNAYTGKANEFPFLDHANKTYLFDVVLSYASEDRIYAEALADSLRPRGIKVFCYSQDMDQERIFDLWGKSLNEYILDIYQNQARYCVIFISQYYATKKWTSREKEAALLRVLNEQEDYILPIRLDDTELPSISSSTVYIRWHKVTVESIADVLVEKLREISRILPNTN